MERFEKATFAVIGKEGSTAEGDGFVKRLWDAANARFYEVAPLAVRDENGNPARVWGAMTDFSRAFLPWADGFTKGLYLAGVECGMSAQPPEGWTKWVVPGFAYLRTENDAPDAFARGLRALEEARETLVGAVQEMTVPATGQSYLCYPIRRLP